MNLSPKVRKSLDIATRLIIASLSVSYIIYRIYALPSGQVDVFLKSVISGANAIYFVVALAVMMLVNWGIESLKWKLLINQSELIGFITAYKAVLGGLPVSVFTPNRVGEFMGRIFILKKTDPFKAILLTIVGSFSQLLVTLVLGTAAFLNFAPRLINSLFMESAWFINGISISLAILSLVAIIIFFNISVLHRISILLPMKYSARIKNSIDAMADCSRSLLLQTLLLSSFRYAVFSVQFYIAIKLMGLNFTLAECLMTIPVIYLSLAAIPTLALAELGVRGSVAVFLFGLLLPSHALDAVASLAMISASTLIWLINIALPSLAGIIVVFRLKFFRQ